MRRRILIAVAVLLVAPALLATEIVGTGNIEVINPDECFAMACTAVADASCVPYKPSTVDAGAVTASNHFLEGSRYRIKPTDDVYLGVNNGFTTGEAFGTSPETTALGGLLQDGLRAAVSVADGGSVGVCCKSVSGAPTVNVCRVRPARGGY